jgi:hypothetical protein
LEDKDWPACYRIVHLANGVRAINEPKSHKVEIIPSAKEFAFSIEKFGNLYSDIQKHGFKIIGMEVLNHATQIDGLYPPDWRAFKNLRNEKWPVDVCEKTWENLSNAAYTKNDFCFLELARRIQFQITSSSWELKRISDAYAQELKTSCCLNEYKNGTRFESQNSLFIYISVHSFLSNIGTLRDYLAEYIASYLLKEILQGKRITKMASLASELRKLPDKSMPIISEILSATSHDNENGWIAELSDYRDLVVHYAPVAYASHRSFLTQKSLFLGDNEVPGVFFPLPSNPFELRKKRSKGSLHENIGAWLEYSAGRTLSDSDKDSLNYCHEVLFRICFLAMQLAGFAPYKPEIKTIGPSDLRGPIITKDYKSGK